MKKIDILPDLLDEVDLNNRRNFRVTTAFLNFIYRDLNRNERFIGLVSKIPKSKLV